MKTPRLLYLIAAALVCALTVNAYAQQPPVPSADTTGTATRADSSAAAAQTAAPAPVPADTLPKARPADSLSAVPVAVPVAPAAPATTTPAPAAPTSATVTTETAPAGAKPAGSGKKIYYGATVGFTFFGDVTRFYIQPMLGYYLAPRLSVGGKVGYEHLKYETNLGDASYDNWGASVFGRISILPAVYGHAEYAVWSYEYESEDGDRTNVPYLLLGGGLVKRLGGRMALTAEVLFDVLQDENSLYSDWEPWVTVGVQVGF